MGSTFDSVRKAVLKGRRTNITPILVHQHLMKRIKDFGDSTAVVHRGTQLRYSELNENANKLARGINRILETAKPADPSNETIIAVHMKNSAALVETLLAIWNLGAAYMPINVPADITQSRSKPVLLIHDGHFDSERFSPIANYDDIRKETQRMSSQNLSETMPTKVNLKALAVVLPSSHSEVRISHLNLVNQIQWELQANPFSPNETHSVLKSEPFRYEHISEMWLPLVEGRALVIAAEESIRDFVDILEEFKIRRISGEPSLLESIIHHARKRTELKPKILLSNLKLIISRGEPMSLQLAQSFFDYFLCGSHSLVNTYGVRGVTADVTAQELDSIEELQSLKQIPVGAPVHNTIIYVLDQSLNIVNEGEVGEIYISGATVPEAYGNDRFVSNPFERDEPYKQMLKTGDLGSIRNGVLYGEGRQTTHIVVNGNPVDLENMEAIINGLDYVQKCAILVHHRNLVDQALIAIIVTNSSKTQLEEDLSPRLTVMPKILIVKGFPVMPNGKVDRLKLLQMVDNDEVSKKFDLESEIDDIIAESLRK